MYCHATCPAIITAGGAGIKFMYTGAAVPYTLHSQHDTQRHVQQARTARNNDVVHRVRPVDVLGLRAEHGAEKYTSIYGNDEL
ncbi:hypothetical protein PRIPAC_87440, partial [Pristionchus pacificus]|uniref:Uncharacterized protein n=1 Tax=Pristionchus pacificus TaxID=54126 RepID=A0A2A6B5G6_PRIPA